MNTASLIDALAPMHWPSFAVASARVAGVLMVGPLWSLASLPGRIRGAMAVVVTLALMPAMPHAVVPDGVPSLVVPMATETLLGVCIGLSAAVFLHGVAVAAEVISLQMGLSLGAVLSASPEQAAPGIGQATSQFSMAVFAALGGHVALVAALARSFQVIPPGAPIGLDTGSKALVALAGSLFVTAVRIAAPVMVVLLVTNIALAILNRAVPQLNTMMVATPITISVGLIALGAALPMLVNVTGDWAANAGLMADRVVDAFTPAAARP